MKNWSAMLLILRVSSVALTQTSFVPDEYWQSLEIAHYLCYGYGYKTWEWREGIRSYLFPMLIAGLYKVLQLLHIDSRYMLVYSPRVVMALLSWAGDLSVVETARRLHGPRAAGHTAWCLATSWCLFYCCSRTLANTVEMVVLAAALRCYPWRPPHDGSGSRQYLWLGGIAAVLRPTSALVWLPLWVADWCSAPRRATLVVTSAVVSVTALAMTLLVDTIGYGAPTISAVQFLRLNVARGVASHYGTSPWHTHLTASLPTVLTLHVVAVLLGFRRPGTHDRLCLGAVVWLVVVYSALPHKEFRFLLPIWPFCALLAGRGLDWLSHAHHRYCRCLKFLILLINVPVALYLGLVHQRGPLDVTSRLASRLEQSPLDGVYVLYLMPCHSTPLYSHLHLDVKTRFLTCEPNLAAAANYTDEADVFHRDPEAWLREHYPGLLVSTPTTAAAVAARRTPPAVGSAGASPTAPSHVVLFDSLWRTLAPRLRGFTVCEDVFHSHVVESRAGGRILVLCG